MKKAGKGIFAPKKLSDALAAVCGAKTLPRTEVTKKVPASLMTERACSKGVAESSIEISLDRGSDDRAFS